MENQDTQMAKPEASVLHQTDIVSLILEDHKSLKDLIKILKDPDRELSERRAAFEEFAPTLVAHAKPEELVLYAYMKNDEDMREEAFEGEVEHGLADQLVEECKRTDDDDLLGARIKVLGELVEHHIEEEEEELLPEFNASVELGERSRLGDEFLKLKVDYLAAGDDNVIPDPKAEEEGWSH